MLSISLLGRFNLSICPVHHCHQDRVHRLRHSVAEGRPPGVLKQPTYSYDGSPRLVLKCLKGWGGNPKWGRSGWPSNLHSGDRTGMQQLGMQKIQLQFLHKSYQSTLALVVWSFVLGPWVPPPVWMSYHSYPRLFHLEGWHLWGIPCCFSEVVIIS